MADIKKNTRVGPYQLIEQLPGRGGMSSVFRAFHTENENEFALKISRNDAQDPKFNNALRQEIDIMKSLQHPGIVQVLPIELPGSKVDTYMARALEINGRPWFYIMEYLPGNSLIEVFDDYRELPFSVTCAIATRVVDSLKYLHSNGIAHLDIKPENILFRYELKTESPIEPVLIDFGVAARTKSPRTSGGSLHTMAPEQLRNVRGELPPETPLDMEKMDIYSLGVVTYRMWTGNYPFGGITANRITSAVLNTTPIPPSSHNPKITPQADALIQRWLSKDPQQRPTIDELKNYLYYWSDGISSFPEISKQKRKKKFWMFWKK
jgi:eukaryotic-like serine/threonine-protein kinase